MKKTIYGCDKCGLEIGRKRHVSLHLHFDSGIAVPPKGGDWKWELEKIGGDNYLQFCSVKCLSGFFRESLKEKKK